MSEEDDTMTAILMQLMESIDPMISTAEGIRQRMTALGWDDHIAQQVGAAWLVRHIAS